MEALRERVNDIEDCCRRNNLRLVGIPGCEARDPIVFLEKALSEMLGITLPLRPEWLIERAHRVGPRTVEDQHNGRTVIARFIQSGDRDRILRTSQEKGKIRWNGKRVMIFPDFSRGTLAK